MGNDVQQMIQNLEKKRSGIDAAIQALKLMATGGVPHKKRGRPVGWRKPAVAQVEAFIAESTEESSAPKKRRGRKPRTEPQIQTQTEMSAPAAA